MAELEYTYWQGASGYLVGYLDIWPDHPTQGASLAELEEALTEVYEFYQEERARKKRGILKVAA